MRDVCCLQSGGVKSMALVVTYNTTSMQHIVWSVQTASREVCVRVCVCVCEYPVRDEIFKGLKLCVYNFVF